MPQLYFTITPAEGDNFTVGPAHGYETQDGVLSINLPDKVTKLFPLATLQEVTIKRYDS